MSLLFCDSFDHYTNVGHKYENSNGGTISSSSVRTGSAGIRFTSGQNNVIKTLPSAYGTLIAGVAYRSFATSLDAGIIAFQDNTTYQISLVHDSATGRLVLIRGQVSPGSGTTLATSTNIVSTRGIWAYVELKVTFDDTTGSYEVRVNGDTWLSATNVDTKQSANTTANRVVLGRTGDNTSGTVDYDDFYVCDTAGSVNNTFLGDIGVAALFATGAGSSTQWTPSTGSNYQNVDETAPNDDTDYNSSSTVGQKDLIAMGNLGGTVTTVLGVQVLRRSRKDDVGTRQLKTKIKSNTTEANGATTSESSSYVYYRDIFETDPDTSAAWTPSGVNGMEAGYEVVA